MVKFHDNRDLKKQKSSERIDQKYVRKRIKSCVRTFENVFPDKNIRVLDIGARTGYGTKLLSDAGYNVLGTDIIEAYVEEARSKKLPVCFDDILNTTLKDNSFDAIFSRHVIEHCRDTQKFLEVCLRLLKPGGGVFILFPLESQKSFDKKMDADLGMTTAGHMVHYDSITSFAAVVAKTGFNIKYLDYSEKKGIKPMKNEALFIGWRSV